MVAFNSSKWFSILFLILLSGSVYAFDTGKVSFELVINDIPINLNRFCSFILPGETLHFDVQSETDNEFDVTSSNGKIVQMNGRSWKFIPPEKNGYYEITIEDSETKEKIELTVFILTSSSEQSGEYLNGYRIGNYPTKLYKNNPAYEAPAGFVEVTKENRDIFLTPHFQLKQFLCKQQPNNELKYLVIQPELLIKLELLLERLNSSMKVNTLFVMSGYRTPYYNASIGNGKFSRHIYGDAADVYVDTDKDGVIDDLNNDGKASMEDAIKMYNIIDSIDNDSEYNWLVGGLGRYRKTASNTWNIHVDTRGFKARW